MSDNNEIKYEITYDMLNDPGIHSMTIFSKDGVCKFNLAIWNGSTWTLVVEDLKKIEEMLNMCVKDKHYPDNFEIKYSYMKELEK